MVQFQGLGVRPARSSREKLQQQQGEEQQQHMQQQGEAGLRV